MYKSKTMSVIVVLIFYVRFVIIPVNFVNAASPYQASGSITATGQFCEHNICGSITFEFTPEGGSVYGSFTGTRTTDQHGILHVKGNLTGNYAGGDGGLINGAIINAQWWWTSKETGNVVDSPTDFSDVNLDSWSGYLFTSGNGNGTIGESGTWNVTFAPDSILIATDEQTLLPSEDQSTLPTPTNNDVVGKKFTILPQTQQFIASSPDINEATQKIFEQDAAMIVRDENNQFYAIDNKGEPVTLPPVLNSYFSMSNQFAILGNDNWLASSEHGSIRGTINGGGDFVLLDKIPPEMKDRDYSLLATNCLNANECNPVMKINSTASSTKIAATCLLNPSGETSQTGMNLGDVYYISSPSRPLRSSEHGSCRGTINGGGDFIYLPPTVLMASNLISSNIPKVDSSGSGYLGVSVENRSDGAEIIQIQLGSPAELAGLQIGDLIGNISGIPLDDQHTLGSVIDQFKGGDEVILGIKRNGEVSAINLNLATMGLPLIQTPTALIMLNNDTELVVDIGFNGVTGVLVLSNSAQVYEPITGTELNVPAGSAVIVVPGEPLDTVYTMSDSDVNKWWENSSTHETVSPTELPFSGNSSNQTYKGYKDFNPFPNADEENLYWIISIVLGILYIIVLLILIFKKEKQ